MAERDIGGVLVGLIYYGSTGSRFYGRSGGDNEAVDGVLSASGRRSGARPVSGGGARKKGK
jgi:hypothetical protein